MSKNYYYKHREERIKYQREWDKNNKDKKREYDKKRRLTTDKSKKRTIQEYSKRNYFNKLLDKYKGCQLCKSKNKLEIHHLIYDKSPESIMLLCQECHKKIHRKWNT